MAEALDGVVRIVLLVVSRLAPSSQQPLSHTQVSHIMNLSVTPADRASLATKLKANEDALAKVSAESLAAALAALHPTTHSLGYLYLLCVPHEQSPAAQGRLTRSRLCVCQRRANGAGDRAARRRHPRALSLSPRGRRGASEAGAREVYACCSVALPSAHASASVAQLCRRLRDACLASSSASRGLAPLAAAVPLAQPSPSHLVPQLVDLLLLSLSASNYTAVLPLLPPCSPELLDVCPALTGLQPLDFLSFCLLSGTLLCSLKRFDAACEAFTQALVAPAPQLNAFQLACYKKLVLANLLAQTGGGSAAPLSLPKYAPAAVQRSVKTLSGDYAELERAFASRSLDALHKALAQRAEALKEDGNWGLAMQLLAAQPRRAVQRLTQTHLTLPLSAITAASGLASDGEAEALVRAMVASGEVCASIDSRSGMVAFREGGERYASRECAQRIGGMLSQALALGERLRALEEELSCDPAWVKKVMQLEGGKEAGAAGVGGASALGMFPGLE